MAATKPKEREALTGEQIANGLKSFSDWKEENQALVREQAFPNFKAALDFVYQVGLAAEENDHHPDIVMNFKRVKIRYSTHSAGGITPLDFKMAAVVDKLALKFSR